MTFFRTTAIGTALLLASALPGLADGLDASLSAHRVAEGDQVILTLTADASAGAGQPDLSGLEPDFDVLGTSSGRQTTIVNGARSDKMTWQITLSPRHQGDLTIPAIVAGPVSSAPMHVQVVDAGALPAAAQAGRPALSVSAPDGAVYAQQEVPLTVHLRVPTGTRGAEIIAPEGSDFLLEQSGQDRVTPQPDGSAMVERSYLLRPQKAGPLQLGAFTVRAEVTDPNARSPRAGFGRSPFGNSPFADSFFDDFFSDSMFAPTRTISASSDPISLNVQPTPGSASGWVLPATDVQLQSQWQPDPPHFKVGEAVTRKVQVLALGAHGEQIPDLTMPDIPGARVYYEGAESRSVPTSGGTAALREFTWSIVPTGGGEITLPEMSVEWFDIGKEQAARAVLPARTFTVEGPVAPAATPVASAAPAVSEASTARPSHHALTAWLVAGGATLLAGLVAIVALARRMWSQRRPAVARPAAPAQADRRRQALASAARAARAGDEAAMHRASLDWCRAAGLSPADLASRWPGLSRDLQRLEAALFGQDGTPPAPHALLSALRAADKALDARRTRGAALPPLYPATA